MEQISFEVLPLFSYPVCQMTVIEDLSSFFNDIKENLEFESTDSEDSHDMYMSKNLYVLKKYPELKEILLKYFYVFVDNVLKAEKTNFNITTSWVTKTNKKSFSQYHRHKNSFYSGVLYFDDIENCGELKFLNDSDYMNGFKLNEFSEYNIYNSETWKISPHKNKLIFFPSSLRHKITEHNSDTPRYSLAFNVFPTGTYGDSDSTVKITLE